MNCSSSSSFINLFSSSAVISRKVRGTWGSSSSSLAKIDPNQTNDSKAQNLALDILEMSFQWIRLFIMNWFPINFTLVVLHTKSKISVNFLCMLGGTICILIKSNLLQFIEGQTHFSTSWHTKMSLTVTNQFIHSNLHTTAQAWTENLPNKEGVVCKSTHSQPKNLLNVRKNLFSTRSILHLRNIIYSPSW